MRCPQCHADNPDQAIVCLACGVALARTCPQCGTELPPQANFCFHCGSAIGVGGAHPARGLDQAIRRFIPREYAERLLATRGQVGKERRTVTILFSDVKGSTALAEGLDPEEVMEVMDGAFHVLIPPIYYYEGTLARLMGDAVLAFFGAPIAHEDDPERACRAALEIISSAEQYARKLEQERGLAGFNVRVGIHTGLVVMGEVGTDLRVEYTAMGEAVNLAQRLQSAAEPGHVLISADTQRLVAPLFENEALGEMALRGKAESVPVYRVVAAKVVPRKPRGIAGLDSPLVGREAEMDALQGAIQRLQDGQGGIVTIVGEAGIGKSRLVAESRALCEAEARKGLLPPHCHPEGTEGSSSSGEKIPFGLAQGRLRFAQNDSRWQAQGRLRSAESEKKILRSAQNDRRTPVQWVEGRCLSYGGSIAYQLWTDMLHHLLRVEADATPERVRQALREWVQALCPERSAELEPYLANMMALPLQEEEETRLAELSGEQIRAATFDAVQALIECAARQQPLVLVCEDIYWSDPTSMELLEQLLPLAERLPVLFICVFRPRQEHPSWRVREVATRDHGQRHTDLWLQPLTADQSQRLVLNLLTATQLPHDLRQRILERAEGNPFYVEEIIRALIAKGAIAEDDESGQWQIAAEVSAIAIPDTLNGVLTARIDGLPEETRRVLRTAAVIGRIFPYRVLADVARLDGSLEPHLIALQEAELIRERARQPEREYIFKHELTREAAYNGLLKVERRVLHRQVAEALERLFAERFGEQLGLLAHHWQRAGDADKAIDYSLRAGDRARMSFAQQEAIGHFQRALALAEEHGKQSQAARAWMKLGLTHQEAFDFPRARQAYGQGFALWQRATRSTPATPAPPAPHALRMDWFCAPLVFDPARVADFYGRAIVDQLYSSLVRLTPEFDLVPEVAHRWEPLDGGRRYVFHLRDDWFWSDGTPVTADDFEYAWKRIADPATGSRIAQWTYPIKGARAFHQGQVTDSGLVGVRATDRHTLEVRLEQVLSYFPYLAALLSPVPRHAIEANGSAWAQRENLVTNGPFLVESWEPRRSLTLARNPRYPGSVGGNLQRALLHLFDDPARLLQMYENDELDVFFPEHLNRAEMNRARSRHPTEDLWLQRANTKYVAFDVTRPPFDDVSVRRAFMLSTDRTALSGAGSCAFFPAMGGHVPPGIPGHQPDIARPFDPQAGRQLLAEAGYPGGRGFPEVTLLHSLGSEQLCIDLQAQWEENLGVEIRREASEWAAFLQRMRAGTERPHMFLHGWTTYIPDPAPFLNPLSYRHPWCGWQHPAFERLVHEAQGMHDPARRMELLAQAERLLIEEAPIVPLMHGLNMALVKPWVTRFPVSVVRWLFLKDVVLEPH
jgi:ABC-type oligopeptide transport system substrate-binding subunit/class 3 adenylate cyclase/ribosomal protein L40E